MDRQNVIISRIEQELEKEGLIKKPIRESCKEGFGDLASFFDLMVDLRLEGRESLTAQEVWENMKKQLNDLQHKAFVASDDFRKLENRFRNLQNDYQLLIKEK